MDTLKAACVAMLRAGLPIFFGSDVGKFSDRVSGIMDLDVIDYELGFNITLLGMSKEERLQASESQMSKCPFRRCSSRGIMIEREIVRPGADHPGWYSLDEIANSEIATAHAMVLTAVHLDEDSGKPVRWRVQNRSVVFLRGSSIRTPGTR